MKPDFLKKLDIKKRWMIKQKINVGTNKKANLIGSLEFNLI